MDQTQQPDRQCESEKNWIVIGHLGSSHGLQGWMKLFPHTKPVQNIQQYAQWFLQVAQEWQPVDMKSIQLKFNAPKGYFYIKFADSHSPEETRKYLHLKIAVPQDQLPKLPKDDYYWYELEGLTVFNQQDILFGKISHLFSTGSNDVIVIQGDRERLIPYIKAVVLAVDLAQGKMTVDWDEDF